MLSTTSWLLTTPRWILLGIGELVLIPDECRSPLDGRCLPLEPGSRALEDGGSRKERPSRALVAPSRPSPGAGRDFERSGSAMLSGNRSIVAVFRGSMPDEAHVAAAAHDIVSADRASEAARHKNVAGALVPLSRGRKLVSRSGCSFTAVQRQLWSSSELWDRKAARCRLSVARRAALRPLMPLYL